MASTYAAGAVSRRAGDAFAQGAGEGKVDRAME
jgi:hypothetical protein